MIRNMFNTCGKYFRFNKIKNYFIYKIIFLVFFYKKVEWLLLVGKVTRLPLTSLIPPRFSKREVLTSLWYGIFSVWSLFCVKIVNGFRVLDIWT